ncbi:MAG TPA: magnesium transporter [Candidatus Anoxymicrobiaceae bacterium]
MPYLSAMLGRKIQDESGRTLGRLTDVVVEAGAKFPTVKGLVAKPGRGGERIYIPWRDIAEFKTDRVELLRPPAGAESDEGDVFLYRDLLDKQIVDMNGYRIVRVSDIRIARSGGEMRVIGADVGVMAILRRLGLQSLVERLRSERSGLLRDRIVPWNLVSPIGPMPYDVRLRVPYREFLQIHPSDLADIIEQLPEDQRAKILALIEDPKAAEVLSQILPGIRSEVAGSLEDERLSDLLEIMPPDEAADILGSLPREKAQFLLTLMGIEEAGVVSELLGYEPSTAGGRMTTEFIAVPDYITASETIERLRKEAPDAETIYYIYVVDRESHLSGVLSLRDLLRARADVRTGSLMMRDVITSDVDDDQETVAEKLMRYNLLAVPVVDEDHVLKGIVTVDDAIDVIRQESGEDFSQLSGVPFEEEGTPVRDALDPRRWGATMLAFLGGILATALFGIFRAEFILALAVVYFVPLALRASHDVSVWSLAAAVSGIHEESTAPSAVGRLLAREYLYTLAAAALISGLGFAAGLIWVHNWAAAAAGAVGLFVAIAVAGMLGLGLPLALKRARPGPAVGPGRMVVVLATAASLICFLAVSDLLVRNLH